MGQNEGAIWSKVDIQCHTPRDAGSFKDTHEDGLVGEEQRKQWSDDFVTACLSKGLGAIAITDHHDVAMLPYVIDASKRIGGLTVFPGVEVTCRDNVQVLALFDPDSSPELWTTFLGILTNVQPASNELGRVPAINHCGLDIMKLFSAVAEHHGIEDGQVMLLPHFGPSGSHKTLNAAGHAVRAAEIDCDAVYIECPIDDLTEADKEKIQGRTSDWGSQSRAIIPTGDNKRSSWDRLGAHGCWLKLGEHSLEGIRQACLAGAVRVSHHPPTEPVERILQVEIKSTLTGSSPLFVSFNSGYTALIGGRGSGKSAVLEYLRFGLGRSELDVNRGDGSQRQPRDREVNLIKNTLKDGYVRVEIERQGTRETWFRSGQEESEIQISTDDVPEMFSVSDAQKRFRARAFFQKELSTTMVDPRSAEDNITSIAAAEAIGDRRKIDTQIKAKQTDVLKAIIELVGLWESSRELDMAKIRASDIERRLAALRKRLEESGVTAEDQHVLADASKFNSAMNYLANLKKQIFIDRTEFEALDKGVLADVSIETDVSKRFTFLDQLNDAADEKRVELKTLITSALGKFDALTLGLAATTTKFNRELAEFKVEYDAALKRQTSHGDLIAQIEVLVEELKDTKSMINDLTTRVRQQEPAEANFQTVRGELYDFFEGRSSILKDSAEKIAELSDGTLKARKKRDSCPNEMVEALERLFDGSRVRDVNDVCKAIAKQPDADSREVGWMTFCTELLDIYKSKVRGGISDEPDHAVATQIQKCLGTTLTDQQIGRVYRNIGHETVGGVLSAAPKDTIALTYVNGGRDIPFHEASSGQQASALLGILLRQTAGSLIIDQPEDDMDNRIMMAVANQIRASKDQRQLIFTSHNANLVVNGDADKVVVMRGADGSLQAGERQVKVSVKVDGAIDCKAIREEVIEIMEGGSDAFELRARKLVVGQ